MNFFKFGLPVNYYEDRTTTVMYLIACKFLKIIFIILLMVFPSLMQAQTLERTFIDPDVFFKDAVFENSNNGIAVGNNGAIFRTEDSGNNWTQITSNVSNTFLSITSVGELGSFISGSDGLLLKSEDNLNWSQEINPFLKNSSINATSFKGFLNGYAASSCGAIFRIVDGDFVELDNSVEESVLKFGQLNNNTIALLTNNKIVSLPEFDNLVLENINSNFTDLSVFEEKLAIVDRGQGYLIMGHYDSLKYQMLPSAGIKKVHLINKTEVILGGTKGNLYISNDAGETWENLLLSETSGNVEVIAKISSNQFAVLTSKGEIWILNTAEDDDRPDDICDQNRLDDIVFEVTKDNSYLLDLTFYFDFYEGDSLSTVSTSSSFVESLEYADDLSISFFINDIFLEEQIITYLICNPSCEECLEGTIRLRNGEIDIVQTNIITPNEPGINSSLRFNDQEVLEDSEIWIYNRWGQRVFHMKDYDHSWSGEGLPGGVYFYILKYKGFTIKSSLTVVK